MASEAPSEVAPAAAAAGAVGGADGPVNGSWVAEVEDAKAALSKALKVLQPGTGKGGQQGHGSEATHEQVRTARAAVLREYLRLCRGYRTLRRYEKVLAVSQLGLKACASSAAVPRDAGAPQNFAGPPAAAAAAAEDEKEAQEAVAVAKSSFREYMKHSKAELAVHTLLDQKSEHFAPHKDFRAMIRDVVRRGDEFSGHFQIQAVMNGDVRLLEEVVALGVPIDLPIAEPIGSINYPPGTSALLVACAMLVIGESTLRASELDRLAECATLLVNLGADPNLVMLQCTGPGYRSLVRFEFKSAFQIAVMSNRRTLVALMWEHMQMSREERAAIVHCRCGSRLPWKQCHSTGAGQPPHYVAVDGKAHYRISPRARCPCEETSKTYYKCCWNDNRVPVYLDDVSGTLLRHRVDPMPLLLPSFCRLSFDLEAELPAAARTPRTHDDWMRHLARHIREQPSLFAALCDDAGPKSQMTAWDPLVYAGCVERLKEPFLWRDVHWHLDRTELRRRSNEWNEALHKYCDDEGLEGAERERIVNQHAANPCGPCGYAGCSAFEGKVREFPRCAKCKAVAYCSRECQAKDWAVHKKACKELDFFEGTGPVNPGRGGTESK